MPDRIVNELNACLGELWALVRLIRKLEPKAGHPGARAALHAVRKDLSGYCAAISLLVRAHGSGPTDKPNELARHMESIEAEMELWRLLDGSLDAVAARMPALSERVESSSQRDQLASIQRGLGENRRWLQRIAPR